jgi:hypothetical protein
VTDFVKDLAKTRLLKLSKTSRILTAFTRHYTESQMVTIVTVTMRFLGVNVQKISKIGEGQLEKFQFLIGVEYKKFFQI